MYTYPARVLRVESSQDLKLRISLGFDVYRESTLEIMGYSVPSALKREAMNCLILLVGGHKVITEIDFDLSDSGTIWGLYAGGHTAFPEMQKVVSGSRLTDIVRVMEWAGEELRYNSDEIARMLGRS